MTQYSEEEIFEANKKLMIDCYTRAVKEEKETREKIYFAAHYMPKYESMKGNAERVIIKAFKNRLQETKNITDLFQIATDIGLIDKSKYSVIDSDQFMTNIN